MTLFLHQLRAEQRLFWRVHELAFFTFLLPILFLLLLGSVYGDDEIEGVRGSDYLLAGMLGYGVVATAFAGLAIILVIRRESGALKRLRATPLPARTYLAALLASTILVFALEAACLLALARLVFDVPLPDRPFALAVALLVGALAFAALGVGLSALIRSAEGSSAVVNAIYLPVSFISGAFFSSESFPRVLQAVAEALPLVHFIRLVKDVMLRDHALWDELGAVAVVAGWGVAGAALALRRFRWTPTER